MKKKKKILLIITILIILTVVVIILYRKNNVNNDINENKSQDEEKIVSYGGDIDMTNSENVKITENKKINISDKLSEDKKFEDLDITNITMVAENGASIFKAKVANNTDKDFKQKKVTLIFLDKNEKEIFQIGAIIPDILSGHSNEIKCVSMNDITNAYDFKIENIK